MNEQAQASEDLRIIRQMIEQTRRSTGQHWTEFFIWGFFGILASLASHVLMVMERYEDIGIPWILYMPICLVLTLLVEWRKTHRTRIRTFVGRAIGLTWTAITVTILLVWFASGVLGAVPLMFTGGMIALLIGAGVFSTGAMTESRPLYLAAALWWAGGIFMMIRPREMFLIEIVLLLFGMLLPGYLLRRQFMQGEVSDAESV